MVDFLFMRSVGNFEDTVIESLEVVFIGCVELVEKARGGGRRVGGGGHRGGGLGFN